MSDNNYQHIDNTLTPVTGKPANDVKEMDSINFFPADPLSVTVYLQQQQQQLDFLQQKFTEEIDKINAYLKKILNITDNHFNKNRK